MAHLILVRHGKSAWNHLGLWTGHSDVDLTDEGREEARRAGEAIRDIELHKAHTSLLKRTHQTLDEIKSALGLGDELSVVRHAALNERHYGIHTGKNKWQVKEEIGEEAFNNLRRGWDVPIPEGETLKDVHTRAVPYYLEVIAPDLASGKNTIIVAHGNTLRALTKHIEDLDEEQIADVEIGTGQVICYELSPDGVVIKKEIRGV
jgi:2,3-bisphosphoglycerate-dependent phosphoglycerate mutase